MEKTIDAVVASISALTSNPDAQEPMSDVKTKLSTLAGRREAIGEYVSPNEYFDKTKAMPFLGKVVCHTTELIAGSWHEIVLDYEVGSSGLADGAWIKATFKFYSDWALFQTTDPTRANFVSAEYQAGPLSPGQEPASVQSLTCRFDQQGHERPFQKAIIVDIVDGYLNPGDHIIFALATCDLGDLALAFKPSWRKTFASAATSIRWELPASPRFRATLSSKSYPAKRAGWSSWDRASFDLGSICPC